MHPAPPAVFRTNQKYIIQMDRRMEQAFKADQSYVHMHGQDQPCHVYACACFCVRACIDVNVCMLLFIPKTCFKVLSSSTMLGAVPVAFSWPSKRPEPCPCMHGPADVFDSSPRLRWQRRVSCCCKVSNSVSCFKSLDAERFCLDLHLRIFNLFPITLTNFQFQFKVTEENRACILACEVNAHVWFDLELWDKCCRTYFKLMW